MLFRYTRIATYVSMLGSPVTGIKWLSFSILAALMALSYVPCKADVPAPPTPPPVPAGYCTTDRY